MKKAAEKDDKEKRKREKKERKDVKKRDRSSMSAEELLRLDEVNARKSQELRNTLALLRSLSFFLYKSRKITTITNYTICFNDCEFGRSFDFISRS